MHTRQSAILGVSIVLVSLACVAGAADLLAQLPSFQTPYVTRAEALMLLLQTRIPVIPPLVGTGEFSDVPQGSWYERYMVIADRLGIIQPNAVTHQVRPDDPVTRAEFLVMASRTFGINTSVFSDTYADVPLNTWYTGAAGMAERLQLFPDDPDQNVLNPYDFMIHVEVVQAVDALDLAVSDTGPAVAITQSSSSRSYMSASTQIQQVGLIGMNTASSSSTLDWLEQPTPPSSNPADLPSLRQQVLSLVNAARATEGVGPLKENNDLQNSAQLYATEMAEQGFFGHVSPSGETLKDRMQNSGYYQPFFQSDCLCIAQYVMGENLAQGQKTAQEVMTAWMQSPSHREAIMDASFTDTGIGIDAGVWVEHFGGKVK